MYVPVDSVAWPLVEALEVEDCKDPEDSVGSIGHWVVDPPGIFCTVHRICEDSCWVNSIGRGGDKEVQDGVRGNNEWDTRKDKSNVPMRDTVLNGKLAEVVRHL